ncbi:MAG: carbohydrate kinase [Spirochaetes bacterium]|nr:carbohydrate kinase [Spirochaetota bacterium]
MAKQYRIAGLGEILWDVYGEEKYPGGAPANVAANISYSGHDAIILSRIGNDKLGKDLLSFFKSKKINIDNVQIDQQKPTGTVNIKLKNANPDFTITEDVAYDYLEYSNQWLEITEDLDAITFGTLAQRNYSSHLAIQSLLKMSIHSIKLFDVNLRYYNENMINIIIESLRYTDILKLNDKELKLIRDEYNNHEDDDILFIRSLLSEFDIKLAAVTYSDNGCLCVDKIDYSFHQGYKVKVVDTTGAGDAFSAGLIIKYLDNSSLKETASFCNKLGAYVCTKKGACPEWNLNDINSIK